MSITSSLHTSTVLCFMTHHRKSPVVTPIPRLFAAPDHARRKENTSRTQHTQTQTREREMSSKLNKSYGDMPTTTATTKDEARDIYNQKNIQHFRIPNDTPPPMPQSKKPVLTSPRRVTKTMHSQTKQSTSSSIQAKKSNDALSKPTNRRLTYPETETHHVREASIFFHTTHAACNESSHIYDLIILFPQLLYLAFNKAHECTRAESR